MPTASERPWPEHLQRKGPVMRHLPIARPAAALVAACLMTTPFAFAQTPIAAAIAPAGAAAMQPASTPEALSAALVGKTFFLRGFYQDDKLQFAIDGKPIGSPQKGSFALSAVEIDKVKFNKRSMEIEAHRVGLHFFGALPYEDDTKPFERIKVDPKKSMNIEIERLVIEPEKKKKKKDEKKDEKEIGTKSAAPANAETASLPSAPDTPSSNAGTSDAATSPAGTATPTTTKADAPPAIAPNHDPRVSFLQLSKAINVMFAPALDDSVIATLPPYWQNYFATKEGKARSQRVDASALRPGGEVKPPRLLTVLDPASNDYAQKNNIAGMVFLQMVVDAQGRPGAVTIVRPIGFGLDEKAVEAVEHSQFRAGTFNGKPVPELVNLQVTFRIYSNRTKPNGTPSIPTQVAPKESPKMPPSNAPVLASAGAVAPGI
jgi:TonB family protein